MTWSWDPSLYGGSAAFYATGRVAYPDAVAEALTDTLGLDGTGRLVDVGCGPGSLTLLLAPRFTSAVGVDADAAMLVAAGRAARDRGARNVTWHCGRAEDLPADLAPVRVVSFAQSFHWFDQPRVATLARSLLGPDGAVVHVGATTHEGLAGDDATDPLPHPRPPRAAVTARVRERLGSDRRAGAGVRTGPPPADEDAVFTAAGLVGPERIELPDRVVVRTVAEVAASVHSLSWAAPHLFGDDFPAWATELDEMLTGASDNGLFAERLRGITLSIWR